MGKILALLIFVSACTGEDKLDPTALKDAPTQQVAVEDLITSVEMRSMDESLHVGVPALFQAFGLLADQSVKNVTSEATWTSSDESILNFGEEGMMAGTAMPKKAGTVEVTVSIKGKKASVAFSISEATLVSLNIQPSKVKFPIGSVQDIRVVGTYSDGTSQDLSSSVALQIAAPDIISQVDLGSVAANQSELPQIKIRALKIGETTLRATIDTLTTQATFTVTDAALDRLALASPLPALAKGLGAQLALNAIYTDGSIRSVTSEADWQSDDPEIATVGNNDADKGRVTALALGDVTILATFGLKELNIPIKITEAELLVITINGPAQPLPKGATQHLSASGIFSDGSSMDLTSAATWTSDATTIVSVSNLPGERGVVKALSNGKARVRASFRGIESGAFEQATTNAALAKIEVAADRSVVPVGLGSLRFKATGIYTDQSTSDITSSAIWSVSNGALASSVANDRGNTTLIAAGDVQIKASVGALVGSFALKIEEGNLASITVIPASLSLAKGTTKSLRAIGVFSDGSTSDITDQATWSSADGTVATVNSQNASAGEVLAQGEGGANIVASLGSHHGSASVTVSEAALVAVNVDSATKSLPLGLNLDVTATGIFSDASNADLTQSVTWTSSNPAIASISNATGTKGRVNALTVGTTTIVATTPEGDSGQMYLVVTDASLTSLSVEPAAGSLPIGHELRLQAIGTYSNGTTIDLTSVVTWTSASGLATVSNATGDKGLVTGVAAGSVNITASHTGITGLSTFTITSAVLEQIQLTAAYPFITVGADQQFSATGIYSDGTTADITELAVWVAADTAVGTVSIVEGTRGQFTGVDPGSTVLTATHAGESATITAIVSPAALVSILVSPSGQNLPKGNVLNLVATGLYSDGASRDVTSLATWTSSDTSKLTISNTGGSRGQALGVESGAVTVTAAIGSVNATAATTVTDATLEGLEITASGAALPKGTTLALTATGTYSDGSTVDLSDAVTWSSSADGIATISQASGTEGVATGVSDGQFVASASLSGQTATMQLVVTSATLTSIALSPTSPSIPRGFTQRMTAEGTFSDGSVRDLTSLVTWSVSDSAILGANNVAPNRGVTAALGLGTATVAAQFDGISGTTSVTVTNATLESLAVTPATPTIAKGLNRSFTATGLYSDGSSQDLTETVVWTSSDVAIMPIDNTAGNRGAAQALESGFAQITATSSGKSASVSIGITEAALTSLELTPATATLPKGTEQSFVATGHYSDGTTADVSSLVTWSSSDTAVFTVSNAASTKGVAQAVEIGSGTLSIAFKGQSATATLTVSGATLQSLAIGAPTPAISLGETTNYTLEGTYSDGSTVDLTTVAIWASTIPGVATISNADSSEGFITAVSEGDTIITATHGGLSVQEDFTVVSAVLQSLSVSAATLSVPKGAELQLIATGTYNNGSTRDLSSLVTWSSSDAGTVSVSNTSGSRGEILALATGAATLTATFGAISGSEDLTVSTAVLSSIAVSSPTPALALGLTQNLVAVGTYSDGTTLDITSSVTWTSSDAGIGAVSNAASTEGVVTGLTIGEVTLTASLAGNDGSVDLVVVPATLVSLALTPSPASLAKGETEQFVAVGTFSDSSTVDVSTAVVWSSSDDNVIAISNTNGSRGLASALATGVITITATMNGIDATANAVVSNATLEEIQVSSNAIAFAKGTTLNLTATGVYSDGTTQDLTTVVSWASSNTATATISTASSTEGVATGVASGTFTATASLDGKSGTAQIVVTNATLQSIAVNPATPNIPSGAVQALTAEGTYSDGSVVDLTSLVSWTSADSDIVTVSASSPTKGFVTGVAAGSAAIEAALGGIQGSTTVTTTSATLESISVTPASPTIAQGVSRQYTATGIYSDGSSLDITDSVTWASSSDSYMTISNTAGTQGRAAAVSAGSLQISASLASVSGSVNVGVTDASLSSLEISPATLSFAKGSLQTFVATGHYSDGSTADVTSLVVWASNDTAVATVSNASGTKGRVSGVEAGSAALSATLAGQNASANLTVTSASLEGLLVSAPSPSLTLAETSDYSVIGTYSDGSTQDLTSTATWTSSNTGVAVISNAGGSHGRVTAIAEGDTVLTASQGGFSATANLTVASASLTSINVSTTSLTLPVGVGQQMVAIGTYSDATTRDLTSLVTWSSSVPAFASISNANGERGQVLALAAGSTTITASLSGVSDTEVLTINAATLESITLSSVSPAVVRGMTGQVSATGNYSDGSSLDVTASVTWTSSDTGIAAVSNASGTEGQVTGLTVGDVTITAALGGVSKTHALAVTPASLASIAISPSPVTVAKGSVSQLAATGTYSDGSSVDLTSSVTWTVDSGAIATISNATGVRGLLTAVGTGSSTVTATFLGTSGTATVNVTSAALVSISVAGPAPFIGQGTTQQYTATAIYSDASTNDVTQTATWSAADTAVATISTTGTRGVATGIGAGSTVFTATYGGQNGTATLVVTAASLATLAVTPATPSAARGTTKQMIATGTMSDGSTQDLTSSVTWSSASTSKATVSNVAGSRGLVTAVSTGTSEITATLSGVSASETFTVTSATLSSIEISPNPKTMLVGITTQLTATGLYSDGSTQNISEQATWTSSSEIVGTVSDASGTKGQVTSVGGGNTTITATLDGKSATGLVVVSTSGIQQIVISPNNPTLYANVGQAFTASAVLADSSSVDITQSALWESTTPGVASVSNAAGSRGYVSALSTGTTTVKATLGSNVGQTLVTVSAPTIVSLTINPSSATVPNGLTQQFTVTGIYSDSSSADVTANVTWSSSNTGIATVSNGIGTKGLMTGVATGSVTITATSGAVTANANVTISAAVLDSIAVTVPGPLGVGFPGNSVAMGTYSDGTTIDLTEAVTWTSATTATATVSNAEGFRGRITPVAAGTSLITATQGGISGNATVTVQSAVLQSITIDPASATFARGTAQVLTATGHFSDSSTLDMTDSVTWSSSNSPIVYVSNVGSTKGKAFGQAAGTATITAASGAISGTAALTVSTATLVALDVLPGTLTAPAGTTTELKAFGRFSDNSSQDLTASVTWTSSDEAVATISNVGGSNGVASAVSAGTTTFTATSGAVTDTATLTVSNATLVSIAVSPSTATVGLASTQQFSAQGTYSDGSTVDITELATWTSSASARATVSNVGGSRGLASSVSGGVATITASLNNKTSNASLTVTGASLASLAITPSSPSVDDGETVQLTVTATYSDASTQDVTSLAAWSTANDEIIWVASSAGKHGLGHGRKVGTAVVTAAYKGLSTNVTATVTQAPYTVTGSSPQSGLTGGGDILRITGTGFVDGMSVTVGGTACLPLVVENGTALRCTTPVGTGDVDIVVTHPVSGDETLSSAFSYKAPVLTCDSGSLAGNGVCEITTTKTLADGDFVTGSGTLLIKNGGKITTASTAHVISIDAGTAIRIESGGMIQANLALLRTTDLAVSAGGSITAAGYGSSGGSAANGAGTGGGVGSAGNDGGGGGGHVGAGGKGTTLAGGGNHGTSWSEPVDLGSGGGGVAGYAGGAGGGRIKIVVANIMTIDGTLSVNGVAGTGLATSPQRASGGGAAGSLWIDTYMLTGSGSITANGGNGGAGGNVKDGGGGSGGRVSLKYSYINLTGSLQAQGGVRGGTTGGYGAAGSLYVHNVTANQKTIEMRNGISAAGYSVGTQSVTSPAIPTDVASVTLGGGAVFVVANAGTLTLPGNFVLEQYSHVTTTSVSDLYTLAINGSLTMKTGSTIVPSVLNVTGVMSVESGATVTMRGTMTATIDGSLTIAGTWSGNSTITAESLTVAAGGLLHANGLGSAGGTTGNGAGDGGGGGRNSCGHDGGGGGGYGGFGGNAWGSSWSGTGGSSFGSWTEPDDFGSGGGGLYGTAGGAGGGKLKVTVTTGTLTVNGTISANGGNGVVANNCNYKSTGAGSGGSVWIVAGGAFSGTGTIAANGGNGVSFHTSYTMSGAGGGGRIALYYTANTFAGNIQAQGGARGGSSAKNGGAGTAYLKNTNTLAVDIILGNGANVASDSASTPWSEISVDNLTFGNGVVLTNGGAALSVPNDFTVGTGVTLSFTTLSVGGDMTLGTGSSIALSGATADIGGKLTIEGTLQGNLAITAGEIEVKSGGLIHANALGSAGGTTGNGVGIGGGGGRNSCGHDGAGGGGYGGLGGNGWGTSWSGTGGASYGSWTEPAELGSGGGGLYGTVGGAGGGKLKVTVTAGPLTVNGVISANGSNGTPANNCNYKSTGGGSGGSIWIVADGLVSGTGTISANGGNGVSFHSSYSMSGAGSGGRIAVYFDQSTFAGAYEAFGGARGGSNSKHGGAGSVYLKDVTNDTVEVRLSNGSNAGSASASTPWAEVAPDDLSFSNGVVLTGGTTLNLPGSLNLDGDLSVSYSSMVIGGSLNVGNLTKLTVGSLSVAQNLTTEAGSLLTVTGSSIGVTGAITVRGTVTGNMTVTGASIDVQAGGSIHANALGSAGGTTGNGVGTGGGIGRNSCGHNGAGGGGYGGGGGNGYGSSWTGTGGSAYGSWTEPTDLGSGGGGLYNVAAGGAGGGKIKLVTTSGLLTIDGSVSANGGAGTTANSCNYHASGGGSGGSVWIVATNGFVGEGAITANGGNGAFFHAYSMSGGGGGGRVAVHYDTKTFSGTLQAIGGTRGGDSSQFGGAGTVYLKDTTTEYVTGILSNNNAVGTIPVTPWDNVGVPSFSSLSVEAGASMRLPDASSLGVNGDFSLGTAGGLTVASGQTASLTVTGNIALGTNSLVSLTSVTAGGALNMATGSTLTATNVSTGAEFEMVASTATITNLNPGTEVTIGAGSTLTLNGSALTIPNRIDVAGILTGNFTLTSPIVEIPAGGSLHANARGSAGGTTGNGAGTGGGGGRNSCASDGTGGGAHGGYGGSGYGTSWSGGGGAGHGSWLEPDALGSGGGGAYGLAGGAGGGKLKIIASTSLTVDGTIAVNGANGINACTCNCQATGGGSGGSLWIDTALFAGSGSLSANGGNGGYQDANRMGGGGGGGRIAIYYDSRTHDGAIDARGGSRGGTSSQFGGAGTVYLKDTTSSAVHGIIANNNASGTIPITLWDNTSVPSFTSLTLTGGANLRLPDTSSLTLNNSFDLGTNNAITVASGQTATLNVQGNLTLGTTSQVSVSTVDVESNLIIGTSATAVATDLTVAESITIDSGSTLTTTNVTLGEAFTIEPTATVTVNGTTLVVPLKLTVKGTLIGNLAITSPTIEVASGATLHANARGSAGGTTGNGGGTGGAAGRNSCAADGTGGGAYGGNGGNGYGTSWTGTGGSGYGSWIEPVDLGSGGGGAYGTPGGAGGGKLKLVATEKLTLNGTISANGGNGTNACPCNCQATGGGSGGSIWVEAGLFEGIGTMSADGGNGGYQDANRMGGGGGGGRIALYFAERTHSGVVRAYGGLRGGTSSQFGGAGTIYLKNSTTNVTDVQIVNHPSATAATGYTTFDTTNVPGFDSLLASTGSRIRIPTGSTIALPGDVTLGDYVSFGTTVGGETFTLGVNGTLTLGASATVTASTLTIAGGLTLGTSAGVTSTTLSVLGGDLTVGTSGTLTATTASISGSLLAGDSSNVNVTTLSVQEDISLGASSVLTTTNVTLGRDFLTGAGSVATINGTTLDVPRNLTTSGAIIGSLTVNAATITVPSGGSIHANARGGAGGTTGNGAGPSGGLGRNSCSNDGAGGGAHGGHGGTGYGSSWSGGGGVAYGSWTEPTDIGSGGGGVYGLAGGAGGGKLRLITSSLSLDGTIAANGGNGSNHCPCMCQASGGGAGGSLWITTNDFSGSGTLSAKGGNGGSQDANRAAGGGAGGRIAVYYADSSFSGTTQAYGGTRGASTSARGGGAGTILLRDTDDALGHLKIANNDSAVGIQAATPFDPASNDFGDVTIDTGALVYVADGADLVALGDGYIGSYAQLVTEQTSHTFDFTLDGDLTVDANGILRQASSLATATLPVLELGRTLTVRSGGKILGNVDIRVADLLIENGGQILADAYGYAGGVAASGSGAGGGVGSSSNGGGGGGSHAAAGGSGASNAGGTATYGILPVPTTYGSGGGGVPSFNGGAGGGVIALLATGIVQVDGRLSAAGAAGSGNSTAASGGGAGGSIFLTTNELAGGATGLISAAGGNGGAGNNTVDGGGGSGGRLAIIASTDSFAGVATVDGGARGGTSASAGSEGSYFASSHSGIEDPTNFGADGANATSISLSWDAGSDAFHQLAWIAGTTPPSDCTQGTTVSPETLLLAREYRLTGLSPSTDYSFRLCGARYGNPELTTGSTLTYTTDVAPPADPTGLAAVRSTSTTIDLSFTQDGAAAGIQIAYSAGRVAPPDCESGTIIPFATIGADTSYELTGLSSTKSYAFRFCSVGTGYPPSLSNGATIEPTMPPNTVDNGDGTFTTTIVLDNDNAIDTTAYVNSDHGVHTTNYASSPTLSMRHYNTTWYRHISFIKLNDLPFEWFNTVDSANFNFYIASGGSGGCNVAVYRVTQDWIETSPTGSNYPAITSLNTISYTGTTPSWLTANLTSAVNNWKSGTWSNQGFAMDMPCGYGHREFASSEGADPTYRPRLILTYTPL